LQHDMLLGLIANAVMVLANVNSDGAMVNVY